MGIFRLIFFGLLIYLLIQLIKGFFPSGKERVAPKRRSTATRGDSIDGGELIKDPVCGVYIPKDTAVKGHGNSYFCSDECRDKFDRGGG